MPWREASVRSNRCHLGESYLEAEDSVYIQHCSFRFAIRHLSTINLISWGKRKETHMSSWFLPQHGRAIRQVCCSLLRYAFHVSSVCLKWPLLQRLLGCLIATFTGQWAWKVMKKRLHVLCLAAMPSTEVISVQYMPMWLQIRCWQIAIT